MTYFFATTTQEACHATPSQEQKQEPLLTTIHATKPQGPITSLVSEQPQGSVPTHTGRHRLGGQGYAQPRQAPRTPPVIPAVPTGGTRVPPLFPPTHWS